MNEIIEKIIKERQTVKEYSDQKISSEDWKSILKMIYWSPSSHGFEPYRVLIINKENALRKLLQPLMWNQGVVINADKLIFFISLKREIFASEKWVFERSLRKMEKVSLLKGQEAIEKAEQMAETVINKHLNHQENGNDWSTKQAYLALGNALTAATILNLGSTPMEGTDNPKIEKLFLEKGLIKDYEQIAVAGAFGYVSSKTAYAHFGSGKRVRDSWEDKFKEI